MERALKKWMYAAKKESFEKRKIFEAHKIETIDDAFQQMGVYQKPLHKKVKSKV